MDLDRRVFLGLSFGAGAAYAQAPPSAVVPAPAKAKITSVAMLWILPGKFADRVRTAALAGMQSVGLTDEWVGWSDAECRQARRFIESFGMIAASVGVPAGALADAAQMQKGVAAAKHFGAPYVLAAGGHGQAGAPVDGAGPATDPVESAKQMAGMASAAEVTLLLPFHPESLRVVKAADSPAVRIAFSVYDEQVRNGSALSDLKEALDFCELVRIADSPGQGAPGTGTIDFKELYRALQKGGYSHMLAMEYKPKGDAVASLKKAVDEFRAAVNERGMPAGTTEGSLV